MKSDSNDYSVKVVNLKSKKFLWQTPEASDWFFGRMVSFVLFQDWLRSGVDAFNQTLIQNKQTPNTTTFDTQK